MSHAFTTWVLIAGFLLQPVLAYLVTPILTHDTTGQQVVVCTLKGFKTVQLDLPSIADDRYGDSDDPCPAIKLLQMAGAAQVSEPPAVPGRVLFSVAALEQTAGHSHHTLRFAAYSTRAPPALS